MTAKYIEEWHGKLRRSERWQDLESTALYPNDLRVRAAAIEINLAVNNLSKSDETATRLMESAERQPHNRPWSAWELGMLANRGVETERVHELLATWIHDPDSRLGSGRWRDWRRSARNETIPNFLDVFGNDTSMDVRERAGCSLAKSGILTREQRMKAVPGLLELTDDPSLNETSRTWVYQALREITNAPLPNNPATWRNWYSAYGAKKTQEFRQADQWSVLGNH